MRQKFISVFCMILIVSIPATLGQYEQDYERQDAKGFFSSALFGGKPRDVGEWIVVNVDDYEPKIVRQSHLEQEDVPVFISLRGETFGTLAARLSGERSPLRTSVSADPITGVSTYLPVKTVTVRMNGSSPFVSISPRHIPPKKGMFADEFTLDNLGYLIVHLKRLDSKGKELLSNTTNNVITLDMNAEIRLDLEKGNLFGVTTQDLLLKQVSDEVVFLDLPASEQNQFFSSRGFMNAVDISDNAATLVVYDRYYGTLFPLMKSLLPSTQGRVMAGSGRLNQGLRPSLRLSVGEYSPVLNLGDTGDPFRDLFRVRLNEIVTPDDRAVFEITSSGVTSERIVNRNGKLFYKSNWVVSTINKPYTEEITLEDAKTEFELDDQTVANLDGKSLSKAVYLVVLKSFSGEQITLMREVLQTGGADAKFSVRELTESDTSVIEQEYCTNLEIDGFTNYGCMALKLYKDLIFRGSDSAAALEQIVNIYDKKLIQFKGCRTIDSPTAQNNVRCINYLKDMRDLKNFYENKLNAAKGSSVGAEENIIAKGGEVYLDEGVFVKLKKVDLLTDAEKGLVKLRINRGAVQELSLNSVVDLGNGYTNEVNGEKYFTENGEKYNWRVYKINSRSLVMRKYKVTGSEFDSSYYTGSTTSFLIDAEETLAYKIERRDNVKDDEVLRVSVLVEDINVNNMAYVSIVPGTDNAVVNSNFKVHIPVEKRLFEFTPEQMKSQIEKTKEIIKKIDNILNKLDNIIKYWKRTCILTFVVLTTKNSFLGGKGKNLARRSVMEYYKTKCVNEVGAGKKYSTFDECYLDSKNIERIQFLVDEEQKAVEKVNSEFGKFKTVDALKDSDNECAKYLKAEGDVDDCRLSRKIEILNESLGSDDYYKFLVDKFDPVKYKNRIANYDKAVNFYNKNKNILGPNKDNAVDAYLNSVASTVSETKKVGTFTAERIGAVVFKNNLASSPVGFINKNNQVGIYELAPVSELGLAIAVKGDLSKVKSSLAGQPNAVETQLLRMLRSDAEIEEGKIYVKKSDLYETTEIIRGSPSKIKSPQSNSVLYYSAVVSEGEFVTSSDYTLQVGRSGTKGILAQYDPNGRARCYPVGNGEYAEVLDYYDSGSVRSFRVLNVGANQVIECGPGGDDVLVHTWNAVEYSPELNRKYFSVINNARRCRNEGDVVEYLNGRNIVCSMDQARVLRDKFAPSCSDVMDPKDCKLLFNACDPVMCPSSRCNLGGRVKVDNVIQSGLVGSTLLCLPNYKQGIAVPVCLTGISAGLKNVQSVLQGYVDCLETSLAGEGDIGVCDYIRSVGMCEMVWREAINIMNIRGGIIDWVSEKALGEPEGGTEYLTFQSSLQNAGNSFNYFTTEYGNTFLAAYKGKSTDEIGTQICRASVYGKLPSAGDILDQLSEPENPPQYTAFFDSAPYVSEKGDIPLGVGSAGFSTNELNLYKVFYHVYAGTGYPETYSLFGSPEELGGVHKNALKFSVYLKNDKAGLIPLFVTTNPKTDGRKYLAVEKGKYVQQTVQTVGPAGYNEVCIHVTGRDPECGFGKVSSSFALNALTDIAVANEVEEDIKTADECITTQKYTSLGVALPEKYGLFSTGVVRVCNPVVPGPEEKWAKVGSCDKELGSCWLLRDSARIKDLKLSEEAEKSITERAMAEIGALDDSVVRNALNNINTERDKLLDKLRTLIEAAKKAGGGSNIVIVEEEITEEEVEVEVLDDPYVD